MAPKRFKEKLNKVKTKQNSELRRKKTHELRKPYANQSTVSQPESKSNMLNINYFGM